MSIIKYYLRLGDEKVSKMFTPYIANESGIDTILDNFILNQSFGSDLNLLLVEYYVEGKFEVNDPQIPKVSNYSKKGKSISVAFTVNKNKFHDRNEFERREFIVDTTLKAISLVKEKLVKKKLDVDFEKLLNAIQPAINKYLTSDKSYSSF